MNSIQSRRDKAYHVEGDRLVITEILTPLHADANNLVTPQLRSQLYHHLNRKLLDKAADMMADLTERYDLDLDVATAGLITALLTYDMELEQGGR